MNSTATIPLGFPAAHAAPSPAPAAAAQQPGYTLGYLLFIVVLGVLFLRPGDFVELLLDKPLYEVVILCCILVSFPALLAQFAPWSLPSRPITTCVLGLLVAVGLSHLATFHIEEAANSVFQFTKVVLTYVLLVALVTTPQRLRWCLTWMTLFVLAQTILALLQYHEQIHIEAFAPVSEMVFDPLTGESAPFTRICGVGLFGNPNDLSRILVLGMMVCLYRATDPEGRLMAPWWVAVLLLFGYALTLTHSRGGLIGLIVSLVAFAQARFGSWKTLLLAGVGVPLIFVVFAGRQTDIDTKSGTGQQRIQLWSDGLMAMQDTPLFGTGEGTYTALTSGLGAHNSFVHAYTELGVFGGTLFLGACYLALWLPFQVKRHQTSPMNYELERLRPYLIGMAAGYAAGMLTSSRCYVIPTYLVLGLVAAYLRLAEPNVKPGVLHLTPRLVIRLGLVSGLALTALYVYVRVAVQW